MISYLPHRRKAFQPAGGGGTTVYVEHDFTATTTGDLSTVAPTTDELGGGWLGLASSYTFNGSGEGLETSGANILSNVQTDGHEDVRVTSTITYSNGTATGRWNGVCVRGFGSSNNQNLIIRFHGSVSAPTVRLDDWGGLVLNDYDLSGMTTPPQDGDTCTIIVDISGDDFTLVSIAVNGGSAETLNDTYTLTGAAKTDHGAGTGADHYGVFSNNAGTAARWKYFKVESIP